MTGILLATQVETISTRADGSVKIVLGTQELSAGKAAEIFGLRKKLCATYLSEKDTIPQKEIDQVDQVEVEMGAKTPSQRMRNVMWKLWEQDTEGHKEFDTYYKSKMEVIIDHLKSKIK